MPAAVRLHVPVDVDEAAAPADGDRARRRRAAHRHRRTDPGRGHRRHLLRRADRTPWPHDVGSARRAPLRPVRPGDRRPPLRRHVHRARAARVATRCRCCRRAAGATSRDRPASAPRGRRRSTSCGRTCRVTTCAASTGAAPPARATCSSSRWSTRRGPSSSSCSTTARASSAADDFEHAVEVAASILKAAEDEDFPTTLLFADGTDDLDTDGQPIPHIDRLTGVRRGDVDSLAQLADVLVSRGRSLVFVTGEPSGADLVTITKLAHGFSPAYLVSVVGDRHAPLVAPRGMRAIACADGPDFVAHWRGPAVNRPLASIVDAGRARRRRPGSPCGGPSPARPLAAGIVAGAVVGALAAVALTARPPGRRACGAWSRWPASVPCWPSAPSVSSSSPARPGIVTGFGTALTTFLSVDLPAAGLSDLAVVAVPRRRAGGDGRPRGPPAATAPCCRSPAPLTGARRRHHPRRSGRRARGGCRSSFVVVLGVHLIVVSRERYTDMAPLVGTSTAIKRQLPWWRPAVTGLAAAARRRGGPRRAVARRLRRAPLRPRRRHDRRGREPARRRRPPAPGPAGGRRRGRRHRRRRPGPARAGMRVAVLDRYTPEGWRQRAAFGITGEVLTPGTARRCRPRRPVGGRRRRSR